MDYFTEIIYSKKNKTTGQVTYDPNKTTLMKLAGSYFTQKSFFSSN